VFRKFSFFFNRIFCGLEKDRFGLFLSAESIYFDEVYLVTAFVPSETACLANSPGNKRRDGIKGEGCFGKEFELNF
jgi:hypothetical protein